MPASRSARAITLAPRSWPSRPGFAMTTLSLRIVILASLKCEVRSAADSGRLQTSDFTLHTSHLHVLYHRHFFVLAPDVPERVAHLADGRVDADGVDDGRHQVLGRGRGGAEGVERPLHGVVIARLAEPL